MRSEEHYKDQDTLRGGRKGEISQKCYKLLREGGREKKKVFIQA